MSKKRKRYLTMPRDPEPPRPSGPAVRVGDLVIRCPVSFSDTEAKHAGPMRGRVVYVHPQGRFHVVEFALRGGPVRESFAGVSGRC